MGEIWLRLRRHPLTNAELSPAQIRRLESWDARFPCTYFDVVAQDQFSRAIAVEIDDLETSTRVLVTATGRVIERP